MFNENFEEAINTIEKRMELNPGSEFLYGTRFHIAKLLSGKNWGKLKPFEHLPIENWTPP